MKEYYIGLDVHKDTAYVAVLNDKKVRPSSEVDSDLVETLEVPMYSPKMVKALQRYKATGKVFASYEAGCLGFAPYHFLKKHGIACEIIPPNKVFRPGNETKLKTDRRDAILIARTLKRGETNSIYVPNRNDEATRDLIRCRGDLVDDLTRAKQRMQKFLLRHGFKYETNNYWTAKHIKWMKETLCCNNRHCA